VNEYTDDSWSDKVAVITGSSRGIGRTLALRLARGGARIVVNYRRNADLADQVVREVEESGGKAIAVQADVERAEDIERLFDETTAAFGRLDFFVANAAASAFKNILDIEEHHLDRTYATNVKAFVLGAQHAVRMMDRGGRIVAVTSYGSLRAYPTYANLGAAKAAIETWVRYMAAEFAGYGINVNAVNGGLIGTDSCEYFYNVPGMAPLDTVLPKIPKGRMGTAEEMSETIAFLLSPGAEYITGQTVVVDGGLSVVAPPFHQDTTAPLTLGPRGRSQ
jgi:enoyl-[acyl-carrier protein] reductase III